MIPAITCIQKQKKSKPTLWKHGILYPSHIRIGYRLEVLIGYIVEHRCSGACVITQTWYKTWNKH